MRIVITGATGAIGAPVLAAIRLAVPECRLTLISRRERPAEAAEVAVIDLTAPDSEELLRKLLPGADCILHMAADVRWNQPSDLALARNAEPTARLVRCAQDCAPDLRRFVHMSTAFVACPPTELRTSYSIASGGSTFNNSYEFSKAMAEEIVRGSGLPWSIVRPSLVVGDSATGEIGSFNGVYSLMKAYARGLLPFVAGNPNSYVDIVPVDLVAEAVVECLLSDALVGETVWVASGQQAPGLERLILAIAEGVDAVRATVGLPPSTLPPIVPWETYLRLYRPLMESELRSHQQMLLEQLDVFLPYLALPAPLEAPANHIWIQAPDSETYLRAVTEFWCRSHPELISRAPHVWKSRTEAASARA